MGKGSHTPQLHPSWFATDITSSAALFAVRRPAGPLGHLTLDSWPGLDGLGRLQRLKVEVRHDSSGRGALGYRVVKARGDAVEPVCGPLDLPAKPRLGLFQEQGQVVAEAAWRHFWGAFEAMLKPQS